MKRGLSNIVAEAIMLAAVFSWALVVSFLPSIASESQSPATLPLLEPVYWNSTAVVLRVVEGGVVEVKEDSNLMLYVYDEDSGSWKPLGGGKLVLYREQLLIAKALSNEGVTPHLWCGNIVILIDFNARKVSLTG